MGTTVWVDDQTRKDLREAQQRFHASSANATIRKLLAQPVADARTLFAIHRGEIRRILRRHHVRRLVAFGSRARGDAGASSDLDLAVVIDRSEDPWAFLAAEADLEELLGVRVDMVALPNPRLEPAIKAEGVEFAT